MKNTLLILFCLLLIFTATAQEKESRTPKNANITQETYKGTRKEITAEAVIAFNEIYSQVISIAKISQNFFKTDKNKESQFSFNKVSATLNSSSTSKNP